MIRTEGLSKSFDGDKRTGKVLAVDGLSLDVQQGEVFGFLGPNGAGKTTTVRMLSALIAPTAGRAWVNDLEVGKRDTAIRGSIGLLTEQPGMYDRLSAEKNLTIYARLYGVRDVPGQVEKYLRMLGLWERRHDPAGSFSKGMKQKLAIARAILHEPETLFLDEPTAGLDPEAAKVVRDFIEELKTEGPHDLSLHPQSRRSRSVVRSRRRLQATSHQSGFAQQTAEFALRPHGRISREARRAGTGRSSTGIRFREARRS